MDYKVTVRLNDFKYLPMLPFGSEEFNGVLRGKCFTWETDSLDTYSLQRALEKCEIEWYRVKLAPIK